MLIPNFKPRAHILGLTGFAGVGKDTAAGLLNDGRGYMQLAFAWPLREMLGAVLMAAGANADYMSVRELKEQPIPGIGYSYRHLAQTLGDWGRSIDPNFWISITAAQIAELHANTPELPIVISDVRYPNEAAWIKAQGGHIFRIKRDQVEPVRAHSSESHVEELPVDAVIDNSGSWIFLASQLDEALTKAGAVAP